VDLHELRTAKQAVGLLTLILKDTAQTDFLIFHPRPAASFCGEDENEAESGGARKGAEKGATTATGVHGLLESKDTHRPS